jgi:hypothetical protein
MCENNFMWGAHIKKAWFRTLTPSWTQIHTNLSLATQTSSKQETKSKNLKNSRTLTNLKNMKIPAV